MAQINFPTATAAGQEFEADTGVIYTYVGTPPNGFWKGSFQSDGIDTLDNRYVEKTGDTMSGNLGIGTTNSQNGLSLLQGKDINWVSGAGNPKQKIEAADTDGLGFYTGATPALKATLDSSGNLGIGVAPTAKLQVESTSDQLKLTYPSVASYIYEVNSSGDLVISKDSSERLRISSSGNSTYTGNIRASKARSSTAGSDTGGLSIHPSDTTVYYNFRVDSADNELRIDTTNGADKIKFDINGAAEFAGGTVVINGDKIETGGTSNKSISLRRDQGSIRVSSDSSTTSVFAGQLNGSTTSFIKADGSAEFVGNVDCGDPLGAAGSVGARLNSTGVVYARNTGSNTVFEAGTSSASNAFIYANGSAQFADNVQLTNGAFVSNRTSSSSKVFSGTLSGTENVVIKANGSANFNSDVGVLGRVYTTGTSARFSVASAATGTSSIKAIDVEDIGGLKAAIYLDGSADFGQGGCEINDAGRIRLSRSTGTNKDNNPVFEVYDTNNDKTVEIIQNGTASFSEGKAVVSADGGNVYFGLKNDSQTTAYIVKSSDDIIGFTNIISNAGSSNSPIQFNAGNGYIQSKRRFGSDSNDTSLEINTSSGPSFLVGSIVGESGSRFAINQDGSASFDGGVSANYLSAATSSGSYNVYTNAGAATALNSVWGDSGGAQNIKFYNNGNAEFEGNVQIGDFDASNYSLAGAYIFSSGQIRTNRLNATDLVFTAYQGSSSAPTIEMRANGMINVGNLKQVSALGTGIFLKDTGSASASNYNIKLDTNGSAQFNGDLKQGSPNGGQAGASGTSLITGGGIITQSPSTSTASSTRLLRVYHGTNENATIFADGSATFAGQINGTTVGTSDSRFKENITPANPQLADVVALGGMLKNFDWNDEAPVNEALRSQRQLGLIAQEVEEICPSLTKTITRTVQTELTPEQVVPAVIREDGQLITPEQVIPATYGEVEDSYKGISTDALMMKLLGAISELSAENAELKQRLDTAGL